MQIRTLLASEPSETNKSELGDSGLFTAGGYAAAPASAGATLSPAYLWRRTDTFFLFNAPENISITSRLLNFMYHIWGAVYYLDVRSSIKSDQVH